MNLVFANRNEEDAIYQLTTQEIAEAQQQDNIPNKLAETEGNSTQLAHNKDKFAANMHQLQDPCKRMQEGVYSIQFELYPMMPGKECFFKSFFLLQSIGICRAQIRNEQFLIRIDVR